MRRRRAHATTKLHADDLHCSKSEFTKYSNSQYKTQLHSKDSVSMACLLEVNLTVRCGSMAVLVPVVGENGVWNGKNNVTVT